MIRRARWGWLSLLTTLGFFAFSAERVHAQAFGVELHNTVMPASGAMGGVSIARPQDVQSSLGGNPATMARYYGTQFGLGGVWIEPTYNVAHAGGVLPNVDAFQAKSNAQGVAAGNIAVLQDYRALGIPATFGVGLLAGSGAGVDFRGVPESNGTSALIQGLAIAAGAGVDVTERLAMGANLQLGSATLDGPFVGIGAGVYDYALRGSLGLTYDLAPATTLGFYYQTRQDFQFDNAISLELPGPGNFSPTFDIRLDLPENLGLGFADESLLDGRLLLAFDVLYKQWDEASFFSTIYDNQWVFQAGAQYRLGPKVRLRMGYVYAENPIQSPPGDSAGGVMPPPPIGAGMEYVQAQFAAINRHRFSAGFGVRDLLPGLDLDFFAGGMFPQSQNFGPFSWAKLEAYWIGTGFTWRFGRGHCCRLPVPNSW